MRTSLDCLPCLTRQAVDLARACTSDPNEQERLARKFLLAISEMDWNLSAPTAVRKLQERARPFLPEEEIEDPYLQAKERFNRLALQAFPATRREVRESAAPLSTALRIAAAGNFIDLVLNPSLNARDLQRELDQALSLELKGNVAAFSESIANASRILFITDNAGEIVFDKILLELLPRDRITAAVRGHPVLNDATMDDAEAAGLTGLVEVIDTGSSIPGIVLEECSEEFRKHFEKADMVIAKGQGNFETLHGSSKEVWFLFRIECDVVARQTGQSLGDLVLLHYVPEEVRGRRTESH